MHPILRAAVNGTVAGAAATTTMTAFMRVSQLTGHYQKELPPTKVTRAVARTLGIQDDVSSRQETFLTGVLHWVFGMVCGALFGMTSKASKHLPRWLGGLLFGLLVWGVSYMGWIPAFGILPQPWNQRTRHGLMPLVAHGVYGATLGVVFQQLER